MVRLGRTPALQVRGTHASCGSHTSFSVFSVCEVMKTMIRRYNAGILYRTQVRNEWRRQKRTWLEMDTYTISITSSDGFRLISSQFFARMVRYWRFKDVAMFS